MPSDLSKYSDKELNDMLGQSELSSMSDEQLNSMLKSYDNTSGNSVGSVAGAVAGGVALAGAGYGAYKAGKKFYEPFGLKKEITGQLKDMQGPLGIKGTELKYIPQALNQKKNDILAQAKMTNNELNFNIKNINNKLIPQVSGDLSNHIVANIGDFNKTLSKSYDERISAISDLAEQKGFKFTSKNFIEDVLDTAISQAKSSGSTPETLSSLENAKNNILSKTKLTDKYGKPFGSVLSLKDANSQVSKITNQNPYSSESAILRKTWSSFIERNAPDDILPEIQKLNTAYKPAVEARTLVSKFVDSKTGSFDTKKLSKYISDYAKGQRGGDVEGVINLFTKGNDLVNPLPGVAEKFDKVSKLATYRDRLLSQAKNLSKTTSKTTMAISDEINKSKILLSKLNEAESRIANRNIVARVFKGVTGLGVKGLKAIGPLGIVGQAASLSSDPEGALRSMSFLPSRDKEKEQFNQYLMDLDRRVTSGEITRDQASILRLRASGGI